MADSFRLEDILPDVAVGPTRLPRRQEGSSPQNAAVTLLADYSLRTRAWIPSAAIVTLLVESGVTQAAARTAISRLARRGALDSDRRGRSTVYRLAVPAAIGLAYGGREIATFTETAEVWDGTWTLIAFTLPEQASARRRALRGRLRWMGFMPLYDALWVAPHPPPPQEVAVLSGLSEGAITIFRAQRTEVPGVAGRDPLDAWDLAGITGQYTAFVTRWSQLLPQVRAGCLDGASAVRLRTKVMDTYRRFV
ncbi:MAG: PaaX family transcriptional regulator, partial [Micromonosporaceae bacterium]|nr:PaaX family transcriptional regulator [Micromonosporaceae bacterium]